MATGRPVCILILFPGAVVALAPTQGESAMALVKVSANFAEEVVEDMRQRAAEQGISMTELLRQALATQKFMQEEQARGTKVILKRAGENDRELVPPLRGAKRAQ